MDDSPHALMKQCTGPCEQFLPATKRFFYAHSGTKDGLNPRCKPCSNAPHKPRMKCPEGQRYCYTCNQFLPATTEFFYQHKRDGFSTRCRICMQAHMNSKYIPHPMTEEKEQERLASLSESLRNSEKARLAREQLADSRRGKPNKPFANPEQHSANLSKAGRGKKHNVKPRIKFQGQSLYPIQLDLPVFDGCEPKDYTEIDEIMSVYAIINAVTGKMYIGSAVDTKQRWYIHRWQLGRGKHLSPYLQNAWEKYGAGVFNFRILEIIKDAAILTIREQYWLDHYHTSDDKLGYNISHIATRPPSRFN